jgi:hypothetical protein
MIRTIDPLPNRQQMHYIPSFVAEAIGHDYLVVVVPKSYTSLAETLREY